MNSVAGDKARWQKDASATQEIASPEMRQKTSTHWNRRLTEEPPRHFVRAMVNVTNHCNLSCSHCFVFRDGNPNSPAHEMKASRLLSQLQRLRDRHGIRAMLWMGGEPMLRWRIIEKGLHLFEHNVITTNGTIPLKDFGSDVIYVISLDGPPELNDRVRGTGVFERVTRNLAALPEDFESKLMVQCVVHRENQEQLENLILSLQTSRIQGLTFSFYVPREKEISDRAWKNNEERDATIETIIQLKCEYPDFVWNSTRSLELMRSGICEVVTSHCPLQQTLLPLYMEGDEFSTPFCCYGNDVDCDRCGAWGVFSVAARMDGPWKDLVP